MFEQYSIGQTAEELNSDIYEGLTHREAGERLRRDGKNEMKAARKKTPIESFLEQLNDPLIYVLIVAAVVSVLLGEISDAVIIGVVVVMNALVGMLQEGKARKALESLKKLTSPKAMVIRETYGDPCRRAGKRRFGLFGGGMSSSGGSSSDRGGKSKDRGICFDRRIPSHGEGCRFCGRERKTASLG